MQARSQTFFLGGGWGGGGGQIGWILGPFMITRGYSCDHVGSGHFLGGKGVLSWPPPPPPLATSLEMYAFVQCTCLRWYRMEYSLILPGNYLTTSISVLLCFSFCNKYWTRSTQRAQTSLAEADHYSHIVHCKNVEPWLWKTTHPLKKKKKKKKKKKVLDHYLHHDLGMLPLLRCFFAHLLILQYPDHHQNLISSYLYYSGPVHKISSQSVHNFLSNVVHRQTNKQTDRQTNATKNITSFAKEVKMTTCLL